MLILLIAVFFFGGEQLPDMAPGVRVFHIGFCCGHMGRNRRKERVAPRVTHGSDTTRARAPHAAPLCLPRPTLPHGVARRALTAPLWSAVVRIPLHQGK